MNKCLRKVTGAYKRTPSAAVEREAELPPLDLFVDTSLETHHTHPTRHQKHRQAADQTWALLRRGATTPPSWNEAGIQQNPAPEKPKTLITKWAVSE